MKYLKGVLIIVFCSILFQSCIPDDGQIGVFTVLPFPDYFEIKGVSELKVDEIKTYFGIEGIEIPVRDGLLKNITPISTQEQADIVYSISETYEIGSNGYKLEISKNQINIKSRDTAGLFYALISLQQIMEDALDQKKNLPICNITDAPKLSYRAIHLDVKHHREKLDYYYHLIRKLSNYKINGIIVEMEDKLGYELQPIVASEDAISIEDWQKLSEYAKDRFIEISPLIQGLGHASFILKHDEYKKLRDDPESDWAFNPLDPETYKVQFDLYSDAIKATPHGKYLHVGGDEVHTTGRNSGKSPLELQLSWLRKVCKFAEEQGRIPIFWDDMPLKQADVYSPMYNTELGKEEVDRIWKQNEHKLITFLDSFPKNCIYMRWNYDTPEAIGNKKAMAWFMEHGLQVMGATAGQTRWVLMPQNESNMGNIENFAINSIDEKLDGLLLTLWDDDSPHFELYNRGIVSFAQYTWVGKTDREKLKSAYRHREFSYAVSDSSIAFIDSLEHLVAFWNNQLLKEDRRNRLKFKSNPIDAVIDFPDLNNKGEWSKKNTELLSQAAKNVEIGNEIATKIIAIQSLSRRNKYTLDVYGAVNRLVQFSNKAILELEILDKSQNKDEELTAIENVRKLKNEFKLIRDNLEKIYSETRILTKPENYILDQDHHKHLANQTKSFDWQLYAEMLFIEKIEQVFK